LNVSYSPYWLKTNLWCEACWANTALPFSSVPLHDILLDTGQGLALRHNAAILGIDLAEI